MTEFKNLTHVPQTGARSEGFFVRFYISKKQKKHNKILAVILILTACVVAGCNNEIKINKIDGLTHAFTLCQNVRISVNM